jgi:hypothetical protein
MSNTCVFVLVGTVPCSCQFQLIGADDDGLQTGPPGDDDGVVVVVVEGGTGAALTDGTHSSVLWDTVTAPVPNWFLSYAVRVADARAGNAKHTE